MEQVLSRAHGRKHDQMRNIKVTQGLFGYAPGCVLYELGNTKVLCAVTIAQGVPHFLKGQKVGWLTAEYALLPTATHIRSIRDSSQMKKNERAVEISRLIGRALRAVVDLSSIGERTIYIDCDVLQADGSTRTAAITGAYIALKKAVDTWVETGLLYKHIITDSVVAVSVGCSGNQALLDIDFEEDSSLDADYNFVLTGSDEIIEIQGTAEKRSISWSSFEKMALLARAGVQQTFANADIKKILEAHCVIPASKYDKKTPLFSLNNRLTPSV